MKPRIQTKARVHPIHLSPKYMALAMHIIVFLNQQYPKPKGVLKATPNLPSELNFQHRRSNSEAPHILGSRTAFVDIWP